MKKLFLLLSILALCSTSILAQMPNIHPTPQSIASNGSTIAAPKSYQYITDSNIDAALLSKLNEIANKNKKGFKLFVGTKGDKTISKFSAQIPNKRDGYYLSIDKNRIVVAGNDARGTYYGLQTLSQLMKEEKLPIMEIVDYPDVALRGIVEGFYGTPWSFEARLDQIEFYGENKLNTYIYGPKDDPYHSSPDWRKPYPNEEAAQIKALVEASEKNKVNFVWAIHPGKDIKWIDEDRDLLLAKFEKMYDLGVRSFAVFFDDIWGEGAKAEKQAELLNYIDNNFIKNKSDVNPLIMCPTEYNKAWSNIEKGYLTTLGDVLNPTIEIMWTGESVCCEITESNVDWVNQYIKRNAYIWWNFPVSDYVRDHLLMGRVYGNDITIANKVSAFVANPMERAEASKIALYGVASYTWNMEKFDSDKSWKEAIATLMPEDKDALRIFAKHNSDLGPNGHRFRREESVDIKTTTDRILENLNAAKASDLNILSEEFDQMIEAADILLVNEENPALISEIEPWIIQFKNLGEIGKTTLTMWKEYDKKDKDAFLKRYKHLVSLRKKSYMNDQIFNQNPYQPGVKTGSLILTPFVNQLYEFIVENANKTFALNLNAKATYSPHDLKTNMVQFQNLALQVKANAVIVPPVLEVVKWNTNDYMQINLDKVYNARALELDFASKEISEWLEVSISVDGQNWERIPFTAGKLEFNDRKAKNIRLTNKKENKEVSFKKFRFIIE